MAISRKFLVSVIIPVYNVEAFLVECVRSVQNQTYQDLEIILIDDGSTDGSGVICDEFARNDSRIKVIHKTNGGAAEARNAGVLAAGGDYLSFVDADDVISPRFTEVLLNMCTDNACDIAQCDFVPFVGTLPENAFFKKKPKPKILTSQEALHLLYKKKTGVATTVIWNKLCKRALFNQVRFPAGRTNEDEATTYKVIIAANKIAVTDECLYGYRQRLRIIKGSGFSRRRLDVLWALEERRPVILKMNDEVLTSEHLSGYMNTLLRVRSLIGRSDFDNASLRKELLKKYRSYLREALKSKMSAMTKARHLLQALFPSGYEMYLKKRASSTKIRRVTL